MTEDRERVLCRGEPLKDAVCEGAELKIRSWTVQVTDEVGKGLGPGFGKGLGRDQLLAVDVRACDGFGSEKITRGR